MAEQATKIQALIRGSLTRKRLKRDPQFSKMYKLSHRSQAGQYDGVSLDDYGQDDLVLFSNRRYQERKKLRDSARTGEEHLDRLVSLQSEEEISRTEGREKSQVLTDNLASLSASSEEDLKDMSGEEGAALEGKVGEKGTNDPVSLESVEADMREAQGSEEPHTRGIDGQEEASGIEEVQSKGESADKAPNADPVKDLEVSAAKDLVVSGESAPAVEPESQSPAEQIPPAERLEAAPVAEVTVHSADTAPAEEQKVPTPEAQEQEQPMQTQEVQSPKKADLTLPETDRKELLQATFEDAPQEPPATQVPEDPLRDLEAAAPPELTQIHPQQDEFPKPVVEVEQGQPQKETDFPQTQQGTPKSHDSDAVPPHEEDLPQVQALPIDSPETQQIEGEIPQLQEPSSEAASPPEGLGHDLLQRVEAAPGTPEPVQMPSEQSSIIVRDASTPEPEAGLFISGTLLRIPITAETESDEPQLPIIPEAEVQGPEGKQEAAPVQAENVPLSSSPPAQDLIAEPSPPQTLPQAEIPPLEDFTQSGEKPQTPVAQVEERKEEQARTLSSRPQTLAVDTQQPLVPEAGNLESKPEEHEKDISIEVVLPSLPEGKSPDTVNERLPSALPVVPAADSLTYSPPSPKRPNLTTTPAKVQLMSSFVRAFIPAGSHPNPLPASVPESSSPTISQDPPNPAEATPFPSSQEQQLIPVIRESIVPPDPPQTSAPADHSEPPSLKTDQPTFRVANPAGHRPSLKQPPASCEKRSEVLLSPQTIESVQPSYRTPSFPESLKTSFRDTEGRSQSESPSRPVVPEEPVQAEEPEEAPAPERTSLSQVSAASSEELKIESPKYVDTTAVSIPERAANVSLFEAPRNESPDTLSDNSSDSSLSDQEKLDADASLLLPELPRLGASSSAAVLESVPARRKEQSRPPRHLQARPVPAQPPLRKGNKSHSQDNSLSISGSEDYLRPKKSLKSSSLLRHPPLYAKRPSGNLFHSSDPLKKARVPRAKTTELLPPANFKKKPSPYDFQWSKKMLERVFKVGVEVKLRPAIYLPDMKVRKLRKSAVRVVLGRGVDLPEIISRSEKEKQEREFVSRVKDRV